MSLRGEEIAALARGWIGTPYRHQASVKGAGCDCIGLVRGVWREAMGRDAETPGPYVADWAERGADERLFAALARHCIEVDARRAGDVLLFRMAEHAPMKHAAFDVGADRIVHAYWGRAVVESRFSLFWRARHCASFRFPGA